jgi:hypothetical protein
MRFRNISKSGMRILTTSAGEYASCKGDETSAKLQRERRIVSTKRDPQRDDIMPQDIV